MVQIPFLSVIQATSALWVLGFPPLIAARITLRNTSSSVEYNCHAGQSCWPFNDEWAQFNRSLSGNLHRTVPFAASCFYDSLSYDPASCTLAEKTYLLNQPRTEVYGATTGLNWETCGIESCALNPLDAYTVQSDQCRLGRLSALYVDAHSAQQVAMAVQFARKHRLRVSIKNTGHDYFGRSTRPDTLAIWTHHLKKMSYHAHFTPSDCPAGAHQHIGEIGAGAQASDVYAYFQGYGMAVTGGNEGSVGLAGGFGQGGGHGVFGPSRGLLVDNAVEFEVVTAEGQLRTINACSDPELFWAMRGGGGGTFAILTSYKFHLYPAVKINVYALKARFVTTTMNHSAATGDNYRALEWMLTQHVTAQPLWSSQNVSGHAYYWPSQVELYLVLPSENETALPALTREFVTAVNSHPEMIQVSESNYTTYAQYTDFLTLTEAIATRLTPGGIYEAVASRLIPRDLFESSGSVTDLVTAVLEGVRLSNSLISEEYALTQVIMTTPVNVQNGNTTSVHPAWRSALWHVLMTGGWFDVRSSANQTALGERWLDTVQPLKDLTPGGGCYVNEGSYLEPEWEQTFFGANYPALLRVKERYDPTHFLDCWKCVGWEGPNPEYDSL
ncbi:FAD binding domain-containing protein [Aspergillus saccharolyticus JOP 1030-1]|uniref:FAD binding domain-containing protein n=1 Tax=Aspergillus saccharolyticus JOP 1030-1 TaxID=1450539 RepID=A0A318ZCX6_9EURO|nr:FAD binding domain-containing protein [Aspergillus saccharolyticus JOP 1030-1]PYH42493.1 FAD binding domain-containing protein [Aspergillus saccharolyticus JOP 1030-1]